MCVTILWVFVVDYRQVWQSLEDMSRDEAMSQFVRCLSVACPQFTAHLEDLHQLRNQLLSKRWVFLAFLSLLFSVLCVCIHLSLLNEC